MSRAGGRWWILRDGLRAEARWLRHNPVVIALMLAIAALYPAFVSSLYGARAVRERPVLLIDADRSGVTRGLNRALDAHPGLRVVATDAGLERARAALAGREVDAVVRFPRGFARALGRGESAPLDVWAFGPNLLTYSASVGGVIETVRARGAERGRAVAQRAGLSRRGSEAALSPLHFRHEPAYHLSLTYGLFLVPAVLLLVFQQLVLVGLLYSTGLRLEREGRRGGRLEQLGRAMAVLSVAALCFAVIGAFGLHGGWLGAAQPPTAALAGLALVMGALALAVTPLALWLSGFVKDRFSAFYMLMFLSAPMLMVSGYTMPAAQMPAPVSLLGQLLPSTPALLATRLVISRGTDWALLTPHLLHMAALGVLWGGLWWLRGGSRAPRSACSPPTGDPSSGQAALGARDA